MFSISAACRWQMCSSQRTWPILVVRTQTVSSACLRAGGGGHSARRRSTCGERHGLQPVWDSQASPSGSHALHANVVHYF